MNGKPLRFLGVTIGAWALARVAMLAGDAAPLPALVRALAPAAAAAVPRFAPIARRGEAALPIGAWPITAVASPPSIEHPTRPAVVPPQRPPAQTPAAPPAAMDGVPALPPPLVPTPFARSPGRFAGSLWAIGRGAGSDRSVPGAQLGGSQVGVRVTYALGEARRLALAARVSTPLEGRGREAAAGIEWRPVDAPVRLIAERRWSLDGGRGGPTVMVVAGLPPTRIGPLSAEAYAQAGAIARGQVDGFADGAARLSALLPTGRLKLDLGIGAWGGAQPGAARLDIGPSLGVGVPVGGRRVRVTLDWRQRIAGRARPGSGPAVSIGSDF